MGESYPASVSHLADGRAWGESDHPTGVRVTRTDYRGDPDACSPNCAACVPCLREKLVYAERRLAAADAAEADLRSKLAEERTKIARAADVLAKIAEPEPA